MSKRALGKGLDALIQPEGQEKHSDATAGRTLSIDVIDPAKDQPRTSFDEERLGELAESIRHQGIIQPIIVEARGDRYSIVAGERRYRAAKLVGLTEVPVVIATYGEEKRLLVSLIENLQREDLDPIEEAEAYRSLIDRTSLSQEAVSTQIGKSRAAVANSLRLLNLSDAIKASIRGGTVSAGHARALLSILDEAERERVHRRIIAEGLSVRETEEIAKLLAGAARGGAKTKQKREKTSAPEVKRVEEQFIEALGTKVRLKGSLAKGTLEISYFSREDLDRLYELFVDE